MILLVIFAIFLLISLAMASEIQCADRVSQSLQFCNNLSRFLRETRKTLVDEGVLVPQAVASGANGLGTAHQEAPPIAAQAAPATVDYGTFPSTTSHHPKTPVRSFPSPPQSKEEKWADAVEFTASEMNDNPYCKYFPQCFFNPDGPKNTLPQIVNPVPFPSKYIIFDCDDVHDLNKLMPKKIIELDKTTLGYFLQRNFEIQGLRDNSTGENFERYKRLIEEESRRGRREIDDYAAGFSSDGNARRLHNQKVREQCKKHREESGNACS
ncbi:hypothetical protein CAEBREN_23915 [Caenorhabditis brenneri]|uniref:Uncharacterized protein n=1 Tax=Caenorhabditis brenneri TaxID=135651 RepID=G0NX08_CAEBE|nr:hypothetical protein CAEBREN_23915 [Caenorhabditis brenneri]